MTDATALKVRVPKGFKDEIEVVAEEMHISVSALTRLALADYLKARRSADAETVTRGEAA
jgi:predicted transcriptional regulator